LLGQLSNENLPLVQRDLDRDINVREGRMVVFGGVFQKLRRVIQSGCAWTSAGSVRSS
jgi:hypothetical protein